MKDIYRNPILYYIIVPAILALWPLLIWAVYLPDAENDWQSETDQYNQARKIIEQILSVDPDRLQFSDSKTDAAEFDYAVVVERTANVYGIPPTSYKLSTGIITTSAGQKSQSASVVLKQVDIARFARFVSAIQLRWSNLQCSKVKLTRKKGLPDSWDVDLEFKYYY
jgi:hypothetical protein